MLSKRKILFKAGTIQARVHQLALQISEEYDDQDVVLVGLLKGAFVFVNDLGRALERIKTMGGKCVGKVYIDFLSLSSYDDGHTSGDLRLEMDIRRPVKGMHVIIVEDVDGADRCVPHIFEVPPGGPPA